MVWTRVRLSEHIEDDPAPDYAFQWRFHEHPSPARLIQWSRSWAAFIRDLYSTTERRVNRIAYAWIYHQLEWLGATSPRRPLPPPMTEAFDTARNWQRLLDPFPSDVRAWTRDRWITLTLPLMARPELGLEPEVQEALLQGLLKLPEAKRRDALTRLYRQRRRLIADAAVAASEESGTLPSFAPEDPVRAEEAIGLFEEEHVRSYGRHSAWSRLVEEPPQHGLRP
jgi:hypothetical protein